MGREAGWVWEEWGEGEDWQSSLCKILTDLICFLRKSRAGEMVQVGKTDAIKV